MEYLKQAIIYAILIAAVWAGLVWIPSFRRVTVPAGDSSVQGLEELKDYPIDTRVSLRQLVVGDVVQYRLGEEAADVIRLGRVAGLPGDRVEIDAAGLWSVNGKRLERIERAPLPPCGPLVVPADHFLVATTYHENDSVANGPLPFTALIGRVGGL